MKKNNRVLAVILVVLFLVESFSMNCYAKNIDSNNMPEVNEKSVVLADLESADSENNNGEEAESITEDNDAVTKESPSKDDDEYAEENETSESEDIDNSDENEAKDDSENITDEGSDDVASDDEDFPVMDEEQSTGKKSRKSADGTEAGASLNPNPAPAVKYNSTEDAQAAGFSFKKKYEKLVLSNYSGSDEHVVIPYMVGSENVEVVSENAFKDNSDVKVIDIPETVTELEKNSFNNCSNLFRINIMGNACSSWYYSHYVTNCTELQTIYLGKNVTKYYESFTTRIETKEYVVDKDNTVFYNDENGILYKKDNTEKQLFLYPIENENTELILKNTINGIGTAAFSKAKYLEIVNIGNDTEPIKIDVGLGDMPALKKLTINNIADKIDIPSHAEQLKEIYITGSGNTEATINLNCSADIDLIYIGSGIKEIYMPAYTDYKCSVKKMFIGPDVKERAWHSFDDWLGLARMYTDTVEIDEENTDLKCIDGTIVNKDETKLYAFLNSKGSESYNIKDGITEIYKNAFYRDINIKNIVIPSSVKEIDDDAFYGCSKIESLLIPETVEKIGSDILDKNVTIYGYPESAAETYAKKYGYKFIDATKMEESVATDDSGRDILHDLDKVTEIIPKGDTYVIENAWQLAWVAKVVNDGTKDFEGKLLKLAVNVDLSEVEWDPIGQRSYPFRGSFDGQNHTISGLNFDEVDPGGLFGYVESDVSSVTTTFKNVKLKSVKISGGNHCGSLIGYLKIDQGAHTSISGISTSGEFESHGSVGGIICGVGCKKNSDFEMKDCTVNANMKVIGGNGGFDTSGGKAGGIINYIEGVDYTSGKGAVIDNCSFKGNITTTKQRSAGAGIIWSINTGSGEYIISNCVVRGIVEGTSQSVNGGIISGIGSNTTVFRCLNMATVRGGYEAGGITANNSGVIQECENDGEISCTGALAPNGGLVSSNSGIIQDSCNFGYAVTHNYTGGIAGMNSGTIERCYDAGINELDINLWYGNGSITSHNTGEVLYSYSDGESLFGKGQLAPEGNVKTSRLCSSAEMMDEETFETWDFNSVWEMDPEYSYGYPTISAIKDKLKKRYIKDDTPLGKKKERIKVVDENGKPVENAEVKIGTDDSLETEETNKYGVATFEKKFNRKGLLVSKDGYHNYSDADFVMPKTHEYTVRIVSKDGDPYALGSVMMTYNTNRYELLTEEKTINKVNKDTEFSIDCKLADETTEIDRFELVQPDAKDGPSYVSFDGKFKFSVDQFQTTQYKNTVRPIYIRVIDKEQKEHETRINLQVINVQKSDAGKLSFGDNLNITISDKIPVLGGSELKLYTLVLPVTWTVAEDKWELGVNVVTGKSEGFEKMEMKAFNNLKAANKMSEKYEDFEKAYKNYAENKDAIVSKNPEIKLKLIGYATGDLPVDSADFTLRLYASLSVGATVEGPIAGVPGTVFAFDIKGTIYGDGRLEFKSEFSDFPHYDLSSSNIKLGGTVEASLFGGAGVPHLFSVGIYGGGEFGMSGIIVGPVRGFDEIYLQGDLGVAVRALGSDAVKVPVLESEKLYIYKKDTSVDRSVSRKRGTALKSSLSSISDNIISPIDRNSYNTTKDAWNGESSDNSVLISDAYPDMQPQVFTSGGKTIMVLLDDGDTSRNTNDKSMLMYSVYEDGKWSKPTAVWDDKTADTSFSVYSDGTDAYVVWNNERSTIKDNSTFTDVAVSSEVAVARFDSSDCKFVDAENITSNNKYENNPKITIVNSVPYISWTENANDDIWRMTGINSLYVASKNQKWNVQKIADIDTIIIDEAIGQYGNDVGYAYISCDRDSLGNSSEYHPRLITLDGTDSVLSDGAASSIRFLSNEDNSSIIWNSVDGTLNMKKSGDDSAKSVTDRVNGDISCIYDDISTGKKYVIYTRNESGKTNAYMIVGDISSDTWSGEIAITNKGSYIENISAFQKNDKFYVAYNQREIDPDSGDYNGTSQLIWEEIETSKSELEIYDFDYNPFELKRGENLDASLTINNKGCKDVSKVRVQVVNGDETYYDEVLEENINGGKNKEVSISIQIPDDFEQQEVEIIVTDVDDASSEEKAVWNETLGNAILSLDLKKYCFNGNYEFVTTVTNSGCTAVSGSVEAYNIDTGKVYESNDFRNLNTDESINISTQLKGVNWDEVNILNIGFRIVGVDENVILDDSDRTTKIEKKQRVSVQAMKLSQYTAELSEDNLTVQLEANVVPEDAENQNFTWKSSDESIVGVDENGLVTAVAGGVARIYAISEDGNKAASCTITSSLPKLAKKLTVKYSYINSSYKNNADIIKLNSMDKRQLYVEAYPEDASIDSLKWIVEDPRIAVISSDGILTGLRPGSTMVTAQSGKAKTSFMVEVAQSSGNDVWVDDINDLQDLPGGKNIYYQSKDPDTKYIAFSFDDNTSISFNDLYIYDLSGNRIGDAYGYSRMTNKVFLVPGNGFRLYMRNWTSTEYTYSVKNIQEYKDDNIIVEKEQINMSCLDTKTISDELVLPDEDESDESAEWESDDSNIVSIEDEGVIKALHPGTTVVYAKYSFVTVKYPVLVESDDNFSFVSKAEDIKGFGMEECSFGYIAPDKNTKYIKLVFSDESKLTSGHIIIKDGNSSSFWKDFRYDYESYVVFIQGNTFKLNYEPGENETGGFQVISLETFNEIPLSDFSIKDINTKFHRSEFININPEPKELSAYKIPVSYTVKDEDIAEVTTDGWVYGLKNGTTIITAQIKTATGVLEKSFNVKVEPRNFIIFNKDEYSVINGVITPELDISDDDYFYQTLEEGEDYTVTIKGDKLIITGINDYAGCSDEFTVEIINTSSDDNDNNNNDNGNKKPAQVIKVKNITINGISKKIAAGKTIQLTAVVSPQNAQNKKLIWSTDNRKYATVDQNGKVKLLKKGAGKNVKILACASDGSGTIAVYNIKIMKNAVTKIKISGKKNVKAGKKIKLKTKIKTNGRSANKKLEWSSSNTAYATVNKKGVVKTKKAGKGKEVIITAKSTDGSNKVATFKVKIK